MKNSKIIWVKDLPQKKKAFLTKKKKTTTDWTTNDLSIKDYLTKKKKTTNDFATRDYLNRKKRGVDPLLNIRPRSKNVYKIVVNERQEVKDILYPFIEEFIKIRLKYKKMPKTSCNDARSDVVEFFRENPKSPDKIGPMIINVILEETENKFTREEVINTMINKIYQHKIDYLYFSFRDFLISSENKNTTMSLWNKISESCHV